ncbi:MAG: RtcB family protein [Planctomycetota bacterium]
MPGSMADGSRIVFGRGNADSLNSSAHGAGRAMSRRQAAQTIPAKSLMRMMGNIVYQKDRVDALRDEAPMAYKNLNEVMQVQSDLVRTEQILRTVLNYKGG